MTEYFKAVRDKIPEIIENSGKTCKVRTLDDDKFLTMLEKKLDEEVAEYQSNKSVEELADILEVVFRIAELRGTDASALEAARHDKSTNNGRFEKNLFLVSSEYKKEYQSE